MLKKFPRPQTGPLTKQPGWGIIQVQRVPPADGSPSVVERSNRYFRKRRLLLFAFRIRENSNNEHTELKQIRPCNNHICHPLSLSIGGKRRSSPPMKKRRGNRLPGCWRHHRQHSTAFDQMQEKRDSISLFKKFFCQGTEPLTKPPGQGTMQLQGSCQQTAPQVRSKEVTVLRQIGRLPLFVFCIRENSEDKDTELNQIRPW